MDPRALELVLDREEAFVVSGTVHDEVRAPAEFRVRPVVKQERMQSG